MSRQGTKSGQGDDYQIAVAIHWVIRLLSDDNIDYIQAESNGIREFSERVTVDDIVIVYKNNHRHYIQAKKNQSQNRAWSFADLGDELVKSKEQLCADSTALVYFYSSTPFGEFKSLADACREYPDFPAFQREAGNRQNDSLVNLAERWQESAENSFKLAQRIEFGSHLNFEEWKRQNLQELERLVTKPDTTLAILESFVNAHQSKQVGTSFEIRSEQVFTELRKHGVISAPTYVTQEILDKFADISRIGRDWNRSVGGRQIARPELGEVLHSIREQKETILIVDRPGSGKTCLLLDIIEQLERDENTASLFLKGDRFITKETRCDLPNDLVEMCARLVESKPLVVIIDSLDVLSLNRDSGSLNYFLSLIDRLQGISNITLIAACRTFDLQYDAKLRDRTWAKKVELADFDFDGVVAPLLSGWGVKAEALNTELKQLLCLPQNLRLFESIASLDRGLEIRNPYELQAVFLDECVRKHPDLGTTGLQSLQKLAHLLLSSRLHQLSITQFPGDESIRRNLISQNVLFEDSGKIAFSHQTLFDTLVVQHALANDKDFLSFILEYPPFPFLRASVQTFVFHLRIYSPELFSRQITKALDHDKVAYHLKRLIVETIATLNVSPNEDWPLIRRIFQQHPILFERMFWKTTGNGWFRLLLDYWLPLLRNTDQHWRDNFLRRLELWANNFPAEVVGLWLRAINEDWNASNAHDVIIWQINNFTEWHTEGINTLLESISKKTIREYGFFLDVLGRYATSMNEGNTLLWRFMTRKVTNRGISHFELGRQLDCKFRDKNFLEKHLEKSSHFLDLVLSSLELWAYSEEPRNRELNSAFIDSCPSYDRRHSRQDLYHSDDLAVLLQALENAIHTHASENTAWWKTNKSRLRDSSLLIFLYFLIKPYSDSPESHADGISALLTNAEFFRYGRLDYEIGQLMQTSYFLLPEIAQLENQRIILGLYNGDDWVGYQENNEPPQWVYRKRYNYLLWIPVIYRTEESQSFINQFENSFGRFLPEPDIRSRGGTVSYPLTLEQMLSFTDIALISYCKHYEGYDDGFGHHPGDHLRGDQGMVQRRLSEAAAYDPPRYLKLIPIFFSSELDAGYAQNIVHGVADHLRYRYGNLTPAGGEFKRVQPEVNGEPLAEKLLLLMEKNWLWTDTNQFNLFMIPEACCEVLRQQEQTEKLVFILFQFLFDLRHQKIRKNFEEPLTEKSERDVRFRAINSDWGHIGSGVAKLCSRLLEEEQNIPELLFPLLRHLVKASEQAAITIIDQIPYITYKNPEWGFQLFSDIYDGNSPPYLWGVAQQHLYYQYHSNFEYVQPYLERMLRSGDPEALQGWGLLSTMSHLSRHISQDQLFEKLANVNKEEVWIAATQVFAANLDKHIRDGLCISGLTRILELELGLPKVIGEIEDAFDPKEHGSCLGLDFARLYIEKASFNEDRWSIKHLLDWIADLSNRDPLATLELMEKLADRLSTESARRLYDGKSLIQALNTLLREADETDDKILITRVINLQDRLLQLDLYGIEDFFKAAEKN
ncbi:MAG: ATP-binding protein [Thiothrix sp.]|uniref:AAA family ATPase n=1 Tax=Thiothrix sp. TaxID=1032 RepID=UPI00260F87FF|nr:ATP-binding protein [Thiothrix sp.]MDD5391757.1 ATP-binding protein [Thiothrix sp.]